MKSIMNKMVLLEQQINKNQKAMSALLFETDSSTRTHFLEHENNIFIPVLDEATGEKSYAPRNFDEFLLECEGDETKNDFNRFDHVYAVLDESFEYERQFYFLDDSQLLEQEGEEQEEKKGFAQRAKEKVAGGIKKAGETFKRGKLVFFLKTVQAGLKLALAASKSAYSLIAKLLLKISGGMLKAWASAKLEASELWKKISAWGSENLPKIMEKVMKPFLWIANKLTNDTKKAAEIAPLIFSITVMSLSLAWIYVSGGLNIFSSFTDSLQGGMQSIIEAVPEEVAGGMCAEAKLSGSQKIGQALIIEQCGVIDSYGNEVDQRIVAKLMSTMGQEIKDNLDQAKGITIHAVEAVLASGEVVTGQDIDFGGIVDQTASDLEAVISGVDPGQDQLDLNSYGEAFAARMQERIDSIGAALGDKVISNEELQELAKQTKFTHMVNSAQANMQTTHGLVRETIMSKAHVIVTNIQGPGINENQFKRFKELAGILKS